MAHAERVRKYGDPRSEIPVRERTGVIVKRLNRGTYRYLWKPDHPLAHRDGYVAEHRFVAFEAGLLRDVAMQVHHLNHDTLDNRLENLAVVTPAEHRKVHAQEDGVSNQFGVHKACAEVCRLCGRPGKSRDLCVAHYSRLVRYGDPLVVMRVTPSTIAPYVLCSGQRSVS